MIGEGSNAASEWLRVGWSILSTVETAPTFDQLRPFISDDFSSEDRRRGRPTFPNADADAYARELVSFWQTGVGMPHGKVREVLGVQGERFAACVVELDYGNGMTATWIQVVALDANLRVCQREIAFDVDDIEGALAELNRLSTEKAIWPS